MVQKKNYILLLIVLISVSCQTKNPFDVDLSDVEKPDVRFKRFEKVLFSLNPDSLREGLVAQRPNYSFFIGDQIDTLDILNLYNFITDPTIKKACEDVLKAFPDTQSFHSDLIKALWYYRYYYPENKITDVYTYISGFDFEHPVKYADSVLVIGVDMYMGSDYYLYPMLGMPEYKTYRMRRESIVVDCMSEIARTIVPLNSLQFNFLDRMIYEGKLLYFLDITLPWASDSLKSGFTGTQMEWCTRNEKNIWGFFMEQDLLYSTDRKIIARFMDDGPYTPSFAAESPARTGAYIGWQIVRNFMENTSTDPQKLFQMSDSQLILKKSKYKPSNK